MSTENLPNQYKESVDAINAFRKKARRLVEDEKALKETAHFSSIDNIKEFVDSLNEEDMKWFDFVNEEQHSLGRGEMHHLSSKQIDTYKAKIEEFKNARNNFQGIRSIWYEFLANKLNIAAMKLFILETKRGKSDF